MESVKSNNLITSTTAKILLYNVFDHKIQLPNQIAQNIFTTNTTNNINSTDFKQTFDESRSEYVINDIIFKLFRPVIFLCSLVLLRVIIY